MPCPFTGRKMFCTSPNFCVELKIYLHIVPVTNIGFCASTKVFEEALNAVKFLYWLKKFGPAQNILQPAKTQGIGDIMQFSDNFCGGQKCH